MKKFEFKNDHKNMKKTEPTKIDSLEKQPKFNVPSRYKSQESKFYETPWFWASLVIIIMCLTRPLKIIICGNGNGNGNNSCNKDLD